MAWNNADELLVGQSGQVSVAAVGTTLPTTPTGTLNAAFIGLGYTTEDGVSVGVAPDITEHRSWQSRQATRRDLNSQDITVSFSLQQWDEDSVPLAFGGGLVSSVSGGYKYVLPDADDGLDERAMVVDVVDGAEHHRFVFPRGNVTEAVETQFNRSNLAVLPITFKPVAPATGGDAMLFYTDSAAFAAGS